MALGSKLKTNKIFILVLICVLFLQGAAFAANGGFQVPWNFFKKKEKPQVEEVEEIPSYTQPDLLNKPVFDESQEVIKEVPLKHDKDAVYIKQINISGNSLVKTEDILEAMSAKTGMLYDKELIKVNLREIYNMGYFSERIKAVPNVTKDGVIIDIQVEENIPITGFVIKGNNVVSTKEIQSILAKQVGMPQNIVSINKAINEIEEYYAAQGYILARVLNIYDEPDGTIFVEINEGVIDEIKYSGNTKTKDRVIANNISVVPRNV